MQKTDPTNNKHISVYKLWSKFSMSEMEFESMKRIVEASLLCVPAFCPFFPCDLMSPKQCGFCIQKLISITLDSSHKKSVLDIC